MKLQNIIFFFLLSAPVWAAAQEKAADSAEFARFDCGITQTRQKLHKRFFASAPAIELRVNNEKYTYATLQFGKRKRAIYLYLKILEDNICIKKDKNVDVYFKSGEVITLANQYPLNCNSFFARQLKKKEIRKLKSNEITLIKIYTYQKNYELYVSSVQNEDIHHYIDCLSEYRIKKSDEVKAKKSRKKEEGSDNPKTEQPYEPATGT